MNSLSAWEKRRKRVRKPPEPNYLKICPLLFNFLIKLAHKIMEWLAYSLSSDSLILASFNANTDLEQINLSIQKFYH